MKNTDLTLSYAIPLTTEYKCWSYGSLYGLHDEVVWTFFRCKNLVGVAKGW